jgi:ABC-type sugar transport system ATPase subunit
MSNVVLRNLSINLKGNQIIRNLELQVHAGEFLVLLGPSGCGKSTLLHSIAGLIDATSGAIEIGGRDMSDADPSERGIGMVFQSYALYPTMTVEKNMSFGLRVSGTPRAEIRRRVDRVAEMLQLDALLGRKPSQLSGGQRQRTRARCQRVPVRRASVQPGRQAAHRAAARAQDAAPASGLDDDLRDPRPGGSDDAGLTYRGDEGGGDPAGRHAGRSV